MKLGRRYAALLLLHGVEECFAACSQLIIAPIRNRAAAVERERITLDNVLLDRVERANHNRSIGPYHEGSKEDAIGMPVIRSVVVREEVKLVARTLEDFLAAVTYMTLSDERIDVATTRNSLQFIVYAFHDAPPIADDRFLRVGQQTSSPGPLHRPIILSRFIWGLAISKLRCLLFHTRNTWRNKYWLQDHRNIFLVTKRGRPTCHLVAGSSASTRSMGILPSDVNGQPTAARCGADPML